MHTPLLFVGTDVGTEVVVATTVWFVVAWRSENISFHLQTDSQLDSQMAITANAHCSGKIKFTTQLASNFVIWVS